MAKVRVYELAKDLNMTNKQLLNKMKELKIEVKSHMSSLEDSTVTAIKREIFGKKKQKSVKVRPSVIRRRKAKTDPDVQVADIEDEAVSGEAEAAEVDTEKPTAVVRRRPAPPAEDAPEQESADPVSSPPLSSGIVSAAGAASV